MQLVIDMVWWPFTQTHTHTHTLSPRSFFLLPQTKPCADERIPLREVKQRCKTILKELKAEEAEAALAAAGGHASAHLHGAEAGSNGCSSSTSSEADTDSSDGDDDGCFEDEDTTATEATSVTPALAPYPRSLVLGPSCPARCLAASASSVGEQSVPAALTPALEPTKASTTSFAAPPAEERRTRSRSV